MVAIHLRPLRNGQPECSVWPLSIVALGLGGGAGVGWIGDRLGWCWGEVGRGDAMECNGGWGRARGGREHGLNGGKG
jgi:hypothetical protein